ncbi:MAG: hypothetical protein OMM_02052 [Candidatus Magnetoglobus multicellularis str. Araruama]|uniref:Uncharacterized protein n=1 Tax=Candidatus Magnetoglobus multicellularis str. Araruama TaxID=890399 RepID=A0A1V1PAX8_9BACT|nr:MAG: hypothetical protein OMM_02052 [Candidatus Magnetoglobus multicellularis str. Araruama]
MSKKLKKDRKLRKNKQSKLLNMSDDQRIEMARQKLSANNARDAISVLKLIKDAQDNNTVKSLLFQAYMLRETQLSQKGMHVEAEMVLEQAFEYLPDFSDISEDQLCKYLAKTTLPMAVDAYYSYLQKQKPSKNAQYILVDRVCQTGQWKLLDIFDKNDPMCKDRPIMKTVRKLMIEGKWEEAYQATKPLSRMSPYAEYKLFCRGMVSFYAEDDTAMLQAFDRISDSFSFSPTIHELKVIASPMESLKKKGYAISKTDYLWEGPVHLDRQLGQLIVAVDNYRNKEVRSLIYSVAKALYPQKPDWAALHILIILLARQLVQREGGGHIIDMARSILNPQQFKLFQTKYKFRFSKYPFLDAARYLDCLPLEISEPEMQNLAKAMILFYTAKSWFEEMDQLSSRGLKYLSKELNLSYTNNEELLIELVRKGLSFDPVNQSGYELLTQLPRTSRSSKNKIEEALLIMRDKMQNDPVPCLELASLYYEKMPFEKRKLF